MKGYKTVFLGVLIAATGALSTPEMAAYVAAHLPWVGGGLGAAVVFLRFVTNSPIFKDEDGDSPKLPPGAGLVLLFLLPLAMGGCNGALDPASEYAADSSAYTALTAEKLVLSRPCTATVTTVCVDRALAQQLKDSRLSLMAALKVYQSARDAAIAAGASGNDAAAAAAYQSLSGTVTAAQSILSLPSVQAIMTKAKE